MHNDSGQGGLADALVGPLNALIHYCQKNNWSGFDPYDGLNSRIYQATPFMKNKVCRIVFMQVLKRLPVNLRPILLVPKQQNPKALALFLTAFAKLAKIGLLQETSVLKEMTALLAEMQSPDDRYCSWGYSFPWQTRGDLVPRGAANLVCTVFVSNALLDAYEINGDPQALAMAASAADYILNELYWADEKSSTGFSYPLPEMRIPIHNANFLGAALLCRMSMRTGEKKYLDAALKVARYSAAKQHPDGSWGYGELPVQGWVDNFHTGFNLCALRAIGKYAETEEFTAHLRRGFDFYNRHFFTDKGAPKYYHNRIYPIDIHSVAQSIITMVELQDMDSRNVEKALAVYRWAIGNMWDKRGYFYYQVFPMFTNKIPYMRWSQAWMLLAISALAETAAVRP